VVSSAIPPAVVVMGVSGSGKSTVGALLASRLGLPFVDGDALHPEANVRKMAAGVPLDDDDRAPWLDAVGARLTQGGVVVACSALRRAYRDRLRDAAPAAQFVLLHGTRSLLASRLAARVDHFMPAALLDSQLGILELPTPGEQVRVYDIALPPAEIAADAARNLEDA
jgi:gluconokinase